MRRRISLTMMAMVVGALVLAGLGTLGLTVLNSTSQTQSELLSEAKQLARGVQDEVSAGKARDSLAVLRTALGVLKAPLQLQGEAVLAVSPDGSLYNLLDPNGPVTLPSGLSVQQVESGVIEYESVSGHRGRLAWAAYLFSTGVPVGHAGHTDVLNLVVVLTAGSADRGRPGRDVVLRRLSGHSRGGIARRPAAGPAHRPPAAGHRGSHPAHRSRRPQRQGPGA